MGQEIQRWRIRQGQVDRRTWRCIWGIALACELNKDIFADEWYTAVKYDLKNSDFIYICFVLPSEYRFDNKPISWHKQALIFAINFAKQCGIRPFDCLKKNIVKLTDRQKRGVIKGNGDNR